MKKKLLIAFLPLFFLPACSVGDFSAPEPERSAVELADAGLPGIALVKFDDSVLGSLASPDALKEWGVASAERLFPADDVFEARMEAAGLHRWYKIRFAEKDLPATKATSVARELPGVLAVRPKLRIRKTDFPFNDPYAKDDEYPEYNQWHLDNPTTSWADVNVLPLWEKGITGNPNVIVAVVDDGVWLDHPDLKANAIAGNGTNGSYNFIYGQRGPGSVPCDHGTHVAGIIAAVNNNRIGYCGIAGGDAAKGQAGARILGCQIMDESDEDSEDPEGYYPDAEAIVYAANHGAVICNNSWGYYFGDDNGVIDESQAREAHEFFSQPNSGIYTDPLKEAIDYFNTHAGLDANGNQTGLMAGGLVIFAAGNDAIAYGAPANYPGVIAVGATGQKGKTANYSCYGSWVDICAPGGDENENSAIWSLCTESEEYEPYMGMMGTSQATPMVSAAAALIVGAAGGPGFTREKLLTSLISGANKTDFKESSKIGPFLDIYQAYLLATDSSGDEPEPEPEPGTNRPPVITSTYVPASVPYSGRLSIPFTVLDPDQGQMVSVTLQAGSKAAGLSGSGSSYVINVSGDGDVAGTYDAVVTATDNYGLSATATFTYTLLGNKPPVVLKPFDNIIFHAPGESSSFNLEEYITDPDGETLQYRIASSNPSAASFRQDGNAMNVTADAYGLTHVTLSSADQAGCAVSGTFGVLVRPEDQHLSVYPNPVKTNLFIGTGETTENADIRIYNMTGQLLYQEKADCSAFEPAAVNMSDYATGYYLVKVTYGGNEFSQTITKK